MEVEKTEQLNLRMPKSWSFDLEFISRATGMQKTEWVRDILRKAILSAKEDLIFSVEKDYVYGRRTAAQFKEITGYPPSRELNTMRFTFGGRISNLTKSKKHTKFAQKAFEDLAKEVKPITDLMDQRSTGSPFFDELFRELPEKSQKSCNDNERKSLRKQLKSYQTMITKNKSANKGRKRRKQN